MLCNEHAKVAKTEQILLEVKSSFGLAEEAKTLYESI